MQYNPIKKRLSTFFSKYSFLRVFFYKLLDLLLLRAWHIHKELKQWAEDKRDKTLHILDAGAGFGQYAYYLSNMSTHWNILAIDNQSEYVCSCNRFFHKHHKQNILYKTENLLDFAPKNNFDLILSVDVIEQIKEDDQVIGNFYKSLKEEGMLLMFVPSCKQEENAKDSFCDEQIRAGYSVEEIRHKLKQAGFNRVETKYTYGKSGSVSWELSMKYPILAVGTSKYLFSILPFYYLFIYPICYILNLIDLYTHHKEGTGILVKAWK
ncbi:MAG: class I SAM-dependent methyltransferase [Thermonemataceae bacterium]